MKRARIVSFVSILLAYTFLFSTSAYAVDIHNTYNGCVSNSAISYSGSASYPSYFTTAVQRWNNLKRVTIYYSPSNLPNLMIQNINTTAYSWAGAYFHSAGKMATIQYNNNVLNKLSAQQIRGVYTHELGHALALGDHQSSTYSNTMMYAYYGGYPDSLAPHDISDYNYIH